jgi:putative (di)nucleoside polyphosphate hydrolase
MNTNHEFLLVNLKSFETKFYAIPGGGIENGETLESAVYREMKEELNIFKESINLIGSCKDSIKFLFKTKKLSRDGHEYDGMERFFFGFRFVGNDSDIKLQQKEVRAYKWVAYADLKDYLLFDNQFDETNEKLLELFPEIY